MKVIFIILSFILISYIKNEDEICALTHTSYLVVSNFNQPKPSLAKCYRYNTGACCTSVHDDYITKELSKLLTNSCLFKYPDLVDLFCLGCSSFQPSFTDPKTKTIKICKGFLESLWIKHAVNTNQNFTITLDTPTTVFDNCGFKITPYLSKHTDKGYVIPSVLFSNATDFLNKMDFPFFEDYTFEIFDDSKLSPEDQEIVEQFCFKSTSFLNLSITVFLIFTLIFL